MEFSDTIQLLLIGISQGCGYALIAIGFVFIYRATEIVNFAHGELMMLGAFMVLTFSEIWGWAFGLAPPWASCRSGCSDTCWTPW